MVCCLRHYGQGLSRIYILAVFLLREGYSAFSHSCLIDFEQISEPRVPKLRSVNLI